MVQQHPRRKCPRRFYPAGSRLQGYFVVNNAGHLIVVREVKKEEKWLQKLTHGFVSGCLVRVGLMRSLAYRGRGKLTKKWLHSALICPITREFCNDYECLKLLFRGEKSDKVKLCEEKMLNKRGFTKEQIQNVDIDIS